MAIGERFSDFCSQLSINLDKRSSIADRTSRMVGRLNADFRGLSSQSTNRFYVGSYGRGTAIPSVSDVDLLFELPVSAYHQYHGHAGNGQSALLSAVRSSLMKTYPSSAIAGDGQVVVIRFNDGIRFEILPAFVNTEGGYNFADSNTGGSWKACKPKHEMNAFLTRNAECNGNLVQLCRMARAWRDANDVPMNGMLIDTLAFQFIATWAHRDKSYFYYDYLSRDFFSFLANQNTQQTYWLAPGSGSNVKRDGMFEYKARQAELRSLEALVHISNGQDWAAKQKYRAIYGPSFPS